MHKIYQGQDQSLHYTNLARGCVVLSGNGMATGRFNLSSLGAGGSASFGCFGAAPSLFNAGIEWMPDALATQVSDVAIGVGAKHGTEIMRRRPGKPVVDKADGDDDADQ